MLGRWSIPISLIASSFLTLLAVYLLQFAALKSGKLFDACPRRNWRRALQ
jgi:hypothetical protein